MNLSVIGTGYVGLVAASAFADIGHSVFCVDTDSSKISLLREGKLPFFEPGLGDLLKKNANRMQFSSDMAEAVAQSNVIFVAVGTPEKEDGSADLSAIFSVLDLVSKKATEEKIVVLKSTVPMGTWKYAQDFCDKNSSVRIEVVNNPEFLRQGSAVEDFIHPDRVVLGCVSENAKSILTNVYRPLIENGHPIIFMDNTSAELAKYAANCFLAMKISFINDLANFADLIGADIERVKEGFTSDSRINPAFFIPGIGYGGSCFPKDIRAILKSAKDIGFEMPLLTATEFINERQQVVLTNKLMRHFGTLKEKIIAIWGLSFKPNTDDVRRAPSMRIIEELSRMGAKVKAYDPVAGGNARKATSAAFELSENPYDVCVGADALLIVTEWNEFKTVDLNRLKSVMKSQIIFDGRNIWDPSFVRNSGFEYHCIGRNLKFELKEEGRQ